MSAPSNAGGARAYRLPAVEVAAVRNILPLANQRRAQRLWSVVITGAALTGAYFLGGTPLPALALMILAVVLLASGINRLRDFGPRYDLVGQVAGNLSEEEWATALALRRALKPESRRVLGEFVVGVAVATATVYWTAAAGGRWWATGLLLVAVVYGLSSIRALGDTAPRFSARTSDAVASGCRIALFRPFRDGPAGVARNVLLPVLEGYGAVDIVADPTFDRA